MTWLRESGTSGMSGGWERHQFNPLVARGPRRSPVRRNLLAAGNRGEVLEEVRRNRFARHADRGVGHQHVRPDRPRLPEDGPVGHVVPAERPALSDEWLVRWVD